MGELQIRCCLLRGVVLTDLLIVKKLLSLSLSGNEFIGSQSRLSAANKPATPHPALPADIEPSFPQIRGRLGLAQSNTFKELGLTLQV